MNVAVPGRAARRPGDAAARTNKVTGYPYWLRVSGANSLLSTLPRVVSRGGPRSDIWPRFDFDRFLSGHRDGAGRRRRDLARLHSESVPGPVPADRMDVAHAVVDGPPGQIVSPTLPIKWKHRAEVGRSPSRCSRRTTGNVEAFRESGVVQIEPARRREEVQ